MKIITLIVSVGYCFLYVIELILQAHQGKTPRQVIAGDQPLSWVFVFSFILSLITFACGQQPPLHQYKITFDAPDDTSVTAIRLYVATLDIPSETPFTDSTKVEDLQPYFFKEVAIGIDTVFWPVRMEGNWLHVAGTGVNAQGQESDPAVSNFLFNPQGLKIKIE